MLSGLIMAEWAVRYGLYYGIYLLELVLFIFLLQRGRWRRRGAVFFYVTSLLAIDGVGRSYVLFRYGLGSREYAYFFWLTDVLLALAAFTLVCSFFRRACITHARLWHFLRLLLIFVFILVLGISLLSLSRNYDQLLTRFIVEFEQNLYFTCLVLNTMLYLMMQQLESRDEELNLLVCGVGIQFAGPAASLALVYLTPGQDYAISLHSLIAPLCTLGMLLTWFYAVARVPGVEVVLAPEEDGRVPVLVRASPSSDRG